MQGNGISNASSSLSKLAMGPPYNLFRQYLSQLSLDCGPSMAYTQPHRLKPRLLFSSCALWCSFDLYQGIEHRGLLTLSVKAGVKAAKAVQRECTDCTWTHVASWTHVTPKYPKLSSNPSMCGSNPSKCVLSKSYISFLRMRHL